MANIGFPQGFSFAPVAAQPEPMQVFANLQSRVAVLELELSHVRTEKDAARAANQYLLDSLALNSRAPNTEIPAYPADALGLRAQVAKSEKETRKLQTQLTLLKDGYGKLKLKFKKLQATHRTSRQRGGIRHTAMTEERALGQGTVNSTPRCPSSEDTFDLLDTEATPFKSVPTDRDAIVLGNLEIESVTSENIFAAPPPRYLPHFKSAKTGSKPRSFDADDLPIQPIFEDDEQPQERPQLIPFVEENDGTLGSTGLNNRVMQQRTDGVPLWASRWASLGPSTGAYLRPRSVYPATLSSSFHGDHFNDSNKGDRLPDTHFGSRGIAYCPPKESANVHRTVIIENLPFETTIADVAKKVRGGLVVSIQILDTTKIVNSRTAMIIFFHGQAATTYVEFCATTKIVFGDLEANITLLTSPTWPMSLDFIAGVRDDKHTRCLIVYQFPRHISDSALKSALCLADIQDSHGIVTIDEIKQGTLHLSFQSIDSAHSAFEHIGTSDIFQGCKVFFAPDPCAEPVEDLLDKVQLPRLPTQLPFMGDNFGNETSPTALPYGDGDDDTSSNSISPHKASSDAGSTPARRLFHTDLDGPHKPPFPAHLQSNSASEKSLFDDDDKIVEVPAFGAPLNFGSRPNIMTQRGRPLLAKLPKQHFSEALLSCSDAGSVSATTLADVAKVASSSIGKNAGEKDDRDRPCECGSAAGLNYDDAE